MKTKLNTNIQMIQHFFLIIHIILLVIVVIVKAHYVFAIVLGVSKPSYTDEQLQTIIDNNEAGFDLDGKHYTNYEGTQLQRRIETEIRKQKDIKVLGIASDNQIVISDATNKITALRTKYKQITEASGLKPKPKRMRE